eukprot:1181894-Prorocentrum_minimum.AAC.1
MRRNVFLTHQLHRLPGGLGVGLDPAARSAPAEGVSGGDQLLEHGEEVVDVGGPRALRHQFLALHACQHRVRVLALARQVVVRVPLHLPPRRKRGVKR